MRNFGNFDLTVMVRVKCVNRQLMVISFCFHKKTFFGTIKSQSEEYGGSRVWGLVAIGAHVGVA